MSTKTRINRDARKPRFPGKEVVKVRRDKKLTRPQHQLIFGVILAAYEAAQRHHDDRDADTFRREECVIACGARLSQAMDSHFELLMAHFCALAGRAKEAFEWELKADPEAIAQRRKLHLLREWLMKNVPEATRESAEAYGDKVCRDLWGCPMERATALQLDLVYRKLKSPMTPESKAKARDRWATESSAEMEPTPEADFPSSAEFEQDLPVLPPRGEPALPAFAN
jgi:hypothetical protein